jgi:predicted nucleic acid-binding protein
VDELLAAANDVVQKRFVVVPAAVYSGHEAIARSRVRDASDWSTVALALATDSAILTSDPDFLGSGVVTWTYETLAAELERAGEPEPG